jgi:hypothetical protein
MFFSSSSPFLTETGLTEISYSGEKLRTLSQHANIVKAQLLLWPFLERKSMQLSWTICAGKTIAMAEWVSVLADFLKYILNRNSRYSDLHNIRNFASLKKPLVLKTVKNGTISSPI